MSGETGYWANDDEEYGTSEDFTSIPKALNNKVRHHKMPDLKKLLKNDPGWPLGIPGVITMDTSYRLSINLDNIDFSQISDEDRAALVGYNIYYAKRKIGDIITLSEDNPIPCGIEFGSEETHYSLSCHSLHGDPVANSNAIDGTYYQNETRLIPSKRMMKLHNLFLLNSMPSISPKFLVVEVGTKTSANKGYLEARSKKFVNPFKPDDPEIDVQSAYRYIYHDVTIREIDQGTDIPNEDVSFSNVDDFAYVKNGVNYSFSGELTINNKNGEDALVVVNNSNGDNGFNVAAGVDPLLGLPIVLDPINSITYNGDETTNKVDDTVDVTTTSRTTLRAVPGNVFTPFMDQTLIPAVKNVVQIFDPLNPTVAPDAFSTRFGEGVGDVFVGYQHLETSSPIGKVLDYSVDQVDGSYTKIVLFNTTDEAGKFDGEGAKGYFGGMCSSHLNIAAQYSDPSVVQSKLGFLNGAVSGLFSGINFYLVEYTKEAEVAINKWYFAEKDITQSSVVLYNSDFNKQNEYFIRGINDGYFIQDNIIETGIAFSKAQRADVAKREWRNWLLLNKYVQPSDKGVIINLQGVGNQSLYIHHEFALYLTKDRLKLAGDTTSVVLGSEDIFSVTPYEIISVTEGHTGLRNRNWQSMSPFGYTWIQNDHGKIYNHNGENLDELSAKGMRNFFESITSENTANDDLFSIVNDDDKRRLLVKVNRDQDTDINVLSYSFLSKSWVSFHDTELKYPIVTRQKEVFMETPFTKL